MKRLLSNCFVLFSCWFPALAVAQLTVLLDKVPVHTPVEDSLYLVGSFNNWQPRDSNFRFEPLGDGRWIYHFLTPMPDFEYKITRGSWKFVEGGRFGQAIGNHFYKSAKVFSDTLYAQVLSWEDLKDQIPFVDTLPVRVVEIPENTPVDASLYLVGSFNGWSPGDERYKLHRQPDGSFVATIPIRTTVTEFKICRGNWAAIESNKNGLSRPNRQFVYELSHAAELQNLRIANWEDLTNNLFNGYNLILLLAAIQGLLLVVVINSFKDRHRQANRILSALILVVALVLAARLAAFNREIFQQFPKLTLIPDLIYFLYGPLFWWYLRALEEKEPEGKTTVMVWHFLPVLLAILVYAPLIIKDNFTLMLEIVNLKLVHFFAVSAGIGALYSLFYWLKCSRLIRQLAEVDPAKNNFLRTIFLLQGVVLGLWLTTYAVVALGWWMSFDGSLVTAKMIDLAWLVLAISIFTMGYFMILQPQVFRHPVETVSLAFARSAQRLARSVKPAATLNAAEVASLEALVIQEKPYLNPGLSLADLAELAQVPAHHLSKLINEGFQKNFFDFINAYRVEAFKARIEQGDHLQHTILSLALDVGFNSKTAFNRAFKKHTGITPREYLREFDA
jgi:AraC-like DNA-binding protein